ncbi:Hypothetical predicted protein, partial [Lynx pardinus]
RFWHQQDLLLGPQSTRQILGISVSEAPTIILPRSSRPMPEGSFPNLPVLLSSSTFPEVVSLLHLPEELELLSEAMFVESLNPLVFYTFLTPDKDGESHEQEDDNSEEILGGAGSSTKSQRSSVGLAKSMLPSHPQSCISCLAVDGDLHFVIHIPHSEERICHWIGSQGTCYKLHVYGCPLGAPPRQDHKEQNHILPCFHCYYR